MVVISITLCATWCVFCLLHGRVFAKVTERAYVYSWRVCACVNFWRGSSFRDLGFRDSIFRDLSFRDLSFRDLI